MTSAHRPVRTKRQISIPIRGEASDANSLSEQLAVVGRVAEEQL